MTKETALQVNIANLSEVGVNLTFNMDEDWFRGWQEEDPELEFTGPGALVATVQVSRHGRDILVRGHLEGLVFLACSRCLESFALPVTADFDLLLAPKPTVVSPHQEELSAADLDLDFYVGDVVDLEGFLREQLLLALPLKPLCLETCRGLCPQCGTNLNERACTCQESKDVSPFAALAKLKV